VIFIAGLSSTDASPAATNDTCAGAMTVPASGPFPHLTPIIDVSAATTNDDPLLPDQLGDCGGVSGANLSRSVWYKFTPTVSGAYAFSLGPDTSTTISDTVLAIYTSPNGCAGPSTGFACNDDSGAENRSGLTTTLASGTTYYIVVWSVFFDNPIGVIFDVQLRVTKPAVPANNACAGALVIPASGPFPYQTPTIDTTLADETGDPVETGCAGISTRVRSVWYKFSPTLSGLYVFSSGTETATTVDITKMTLYRNNAGCGTEFVEIVNCSATEVGRAVITGNLVAGNNYYLLVWDTSPDHIIGETSLQIRVVKATAPTVTTLPAGSITSTGATLRAQINPNGVQSRYWFEWGATTNYTAINTARLLNAGTLLLTTNSAIVGFMSGTNHFRAVATNSLGKTYGADQMFYWVNNRPILTSPVRQPGGNFQFRFSGITSQLYVVQGSTNLAAAWADLGPATELGAGTFEYIHIATAGARFRFYKVRVP